MLERLLAYSQMSDGNGTPHQLQDIFHDLQLILGSHRPEWDWETFLRDDSSLNDHHSDQGLWNPEVEDEITILRNSMNLFGNLMSQHQSLQVLRTTSDVQGQVLCGPVSRLKQRPQKQRSSSWISPYGRIHAFFRTFSTQRSARSTSEDMYEQEFDGRVILIPNNVGIFSSYIVWDFVSSSIPANLSSTLTHFPMILNTSEVYKVICEGDLHELITMFENGKASLNDRDEQGRSLLNVSFGTNSSIIPASNVSTARSVLWSRGDIQIPH